MAVSADREASEAKATHSLCSPGRRAIDTNTNVCPLATWAGWLSFLLQEQPPRFAAAQLALTGNKAFVHFAVDAALTKLTTVRISSAGGDGVRPAVLTRPMRTSR